MLLSEYLTSTSEHERSLCYRRPQTLKSHPGDVGHWGMRINSVLKCIEQATECCKRAAAAETEENALRYLRLAAVWLEIAKYRAHLENLPTGDAKP
jgi:hypothetical protein